MDFLSSLHNLMDAGSLLHSFGPYILLGVAAVSYTHLRAHETEAGLVCRLLLV